jgi:4-amino-4-deoxy-L-arabinose transferase-like glycosyltransferase
VPEVRSAEISGLPNFAFDRRWYWAALAFVLATTLVRLAQLGSMELAPDEAYYWDWSRRLALGYYDQGPLIAYVIRATTLLFGTNELGVRFGVLAASAGTLLCSYVLARRIFSPLTGFLVVVILGLTPLMELGSIVATYDPPLVFFWSLAIVWLERALFAEKRVEQNRAWTFAGVATGLGFLSKHTIFFLVPCLVLFLATSRAHRAWLFRPQPYLAFLLVPLFYTGVIWWNAHNHWWTFRHLLFLVKKTEGTPLRRLGDLVGSQALLLGPVAFLGGIAVSIKGMALGDRTAGEQRARFLACMGLPVLCLFCLMSLRSKVQANWPACAWVSMAVLLAGWITAWAGRSRRSAVNAFALTGFAGATGLLLTLLALFPTMRAAASIHLRPEKDATNTAFGWRALMARVQQIRQEEGRSRPPFLIGNVYQYCALMAFYLPDHPETFDLHMGSRLDMYTVYNDRLKSHLGEDAIFVGDDGAPREGLSELFDAVEWEPPLRIWRRPEYAEPIRTVYIARCRRFRKFIGLTRASGG